MLLKPASLSELTEAMGAACSRGERIGSIDLRALNRVVEHTPEDLTVTVEAGITLADLQARLGQAGQWLPVDPPNPQLLTISGLLATGASGPRRFGYGTIRDHLIGLQVVLADGRLIRSGGKVVKNVAGFDLAKLFVGSHGSLGIIAGATFKLRPLPEAEAFVQARCPALEKAATSLEALLESAVTPVVLDWHNLSTGDSPGPVTLVVGFAGTREEVDWQLAAARELGVADPSNLDHEQAFWGGGATNEAHCLSVLPSRVWETVCGLGPVPFVARAGDGMIYYRGGPEPPKPELPISLLRRLKDEYDPKHILPELSL